MPLEFFFLMDPRKIQTISQGITRSNGNTVLRDVIYVCTCLRVWALRILLFWTGIFVHVTSYMVEDGFLGFSNLRQYCREYQPWLFPGIPIWLLARFRSYHVFELGPQFLTSCYMKASLSSLYMGLSIKQFIEM